MIIEREITVNKTIEDAWIVLGKDFDKLHIWASPVKYCKPNDNKSLNGSPCIERICKIRGMPTNYEKLFEFSNQTYSLSYTIKGIPKVLVKNARNNWRLYTISSNVTQLTMKMELESNGFFGRLMQPILKIILAKLFETVLKDFKFYAEGFGSNNQ